MATFDASGSDRGIDLTTFDVVNLTSGSPTVQTSGVYRLTDKADATTFQEFLGSDFAYNPSNELIAGTISGITVVDKGATLFEILGLDITVAEVDAFVDTNDSQGFLAAILADDDNLNGSVFKDRLLGFDGDDELGGDAGNDTLEGGAGIDELDGGADNDSLVGGIGADTLDGFTGDDSMDGGANGDLYFVDSAKDKAINSGVDAERDKVVSTVTYTIDASIEDLTLGGTLAIDGNGNAGDNELRGNSKSNVLDGKAGADTMIGGAGNDTYIVDNVGDKITEAAGGGTDDLVKSSITFDLGLNSNIDDLTLTGADTINGTGNELANTLIGNTGANELKALSGSDSLQGGDGDDTLDGGLGNDTMRGGEGNDLFIVDSIADVVIEGSSQTDLNDTIRSSVSYTLPTGGVNNLELVGIFNLNGTGNSNGNKILGNDANNILDGKAGVDELTGGKGNDTYIVDVTADKVVEELDPGYDIVKSGATYTLSDNVEELQLTGTAAINGTGNGLANKLTGNTAANKLDGGAGADTMIGAAGDDVYVVDVSGDVITDTSGVNDEVYITGADPALVKTYTNIESYNFSLFGAGPVTFTGTTAANRITGTALDDSLAGGSGNDTLDGGLGNDTMDGGVGNDTYVIDVPADKITDSGKDTGDTVQTAGSATLTNIDLSTDFGGIENVTFTGTADLNAVGNDGKNVLTGNAGVNLLIGGIGNDTLFGGAGDDTLAGDDEAGTGKGADSMAGGGNNDVYIVDNVGDKISEKIGEGGDTVWSSINYTLGANLDFLVLLGSGNLSATGNELANDILGNSGNNTLDGKLGADTLTGFDGDDTYFVDSKEDKVTEDDKTGGHDTVKSTVDFTLGDNLEDLFLIGGKGVNGTGNELDNLLVGNGAFNKLDGGIGADTMRGGAGDDTYMVDNLKDSVDEKGGSGLNDTVIFQIADPAQQQQLLDQLAVKLIPGIEHYDFSKFNIPVKFAGDAASNSIIGGGKDDTLTGNGGNDTLDGGAGGDSLTGGIGNDTYVVDNSLDQIVELKNGGTDTIISMFLDYTLAEPTPNFNIENLTLGDTDNANATGNSGANLIRGNFFDNVLLGGAGNDTMFAMGGDDTLDGGAGADSMAGSFGSDTYILDSKSDRVIEADDLGKDTVIAPFDYTLLANFDNLTLTGTAKIGNGNSEDNTIIGNALDNLLDGKLGVDHFEGGKGNDTYILNSPTDTVTEQADEGIDTIKQAWHTYSLAANIENLIFTAIVPNIAGSTGFGNSSDNQITGYIGTDSLQGAGGNDTLDGGVGADTLFGGDDNDTYIIDNAKDAIQEFGGGAIDTIQAKISIDLANYQAIGSIDVIEHVKLIGAGALNATGNSLANDLIGNASANKLIGLAGNDTLDGGAGGDSMVGGVGNDRYIVDNAADKVDESGGTGTDTDTVFSSVTFNLTANGTTVKGEVEHLTLTGKGAINGTGNALDNIIVGNDGANKLDGGLGADTLTGNIGNDTVTGGDGSDTVRFTSLLDGHDVIANFDGDAAGGGQDNVDLDALFDVMGVAAIDRAARVNVLDNGATVDIQVDTDGNVGNGFEYTLATLNTADDITVGADVIVGT